MKLAQLADVFAVEEALQSGVAVITTAHGSGGADLLRHPALGPLISKGFFPVILSLYWQDGQVQLHYEKGCVS